MRTLWSWIARGLIAILPLAVTLAVLWWAVATVERFVRGVLQAIFPEEWYFTGLGLVLSLLILVAAGIAVQFYLGQKLLHWSEKLFARIPVAKTLYGSVKDIMNLFAGGQKRGFSGVVLVRVGQSERILGMVTREELDELPPSCRDCIAVYLPMSYQIGGYTVLVPRDSVERVDMTVEEALKFAMTAGLSSTGRLAVPPVGAIIIPAPEQGPDDKPADGGLR